MTPQLLPTMQFTHWVTSPRGMTVTIELILAPQSDGAAAVGLSSFLFFFFFSGREDGYIPIGSVGCRD
jgi:hypothetical protein